MNIYKEILLNLTDLHMIEKDLEKSRILFSCINNVKILIQENYAKKIYPLDKK